VTYRLTEVSKPFDRLPIRWRLAVGSAFLTLIILLSFAFVAGTLTTRGIDADFKDRTRESTDKFLDQIEVQIGQKTGRVTYLGPDLNTVAEADSAAIRLLTIDGETIRSSRGAPDFGVSSSATAVVNGYRVESRSVPIEGGGTVVLQYGRPQSLVKGTVRRIWIILGVGVIGGAFLALLAGVAVAQRALLPVTKLTVAAREVARTRDPSRRLPKPQAKDEVAELTNTLDLMLDELNTAKSETDSILTKQKEFVADASHELRTPLTSTLMNLQFLTEGLTGEQQETAASALRSAKRMKRTVSDLLILARADAKRQVHSEQIDMADVLIEASTEVQPLIDNRELTVDAHPALVKGNRDDLYRVVLNLLSNAVNHTADGTHIKTSVYADKEWVTVTVSDTGQGVPASVRDRVFDRFVTEKSDQGKGTGLGLAIVKAVVEQHNGTVELTSDSNYGSIFTIKLPSSSKNL